MKVYIDGACSGNPGPGGWAFLIDDPNGDHPRDWQSGHDPSTTNNRMEMEALRKALIAIPIGSYVTVVTDSQNVIGWMSRGWKRNNPAIADVCMACDNLIKVQNLKVTYEWVKGHDGDQFNEQVNELAQAACKKTDLCRSCGMSFCSGGGMCKECYAIEFGPEPVEKVAGYDVLIITDVANHTLEEWSSEDLRSWENYHNESHHHFAWSKMVGGTEVVMFTSGETYVIVPKK